MKLFDSAEGTQSDGDGRDSYSGNVARHAFVRAPEPASALTTGLPATNIAVDIKNSSSTQWHMEGSDLRSVPDRHKAQMMRVPGVVGIGIGLSKADRRKRCIQVYVTTPRWPKGVPRTMDGYEVELVKTAGFRTT